MEEAFMSDNASNNEQCIGVCRDMSNNIPVSNNAADNEQSIGTFRETAQVEVNNIVGKVSLFDVQEQSLVVSDFLFFL